MSVLFTLFHLCTRRLWRDLGQSSVRKNGRLVKPTSNYRLNRFLKCLSTRRTCQSGDTQPPQRTALLPSVLSVASRNAEILYFQITVTAEGWNLTAVLSMFNVTGGSCLRNKLIRRDELIIFKQHKRLLLYPTLLL